MAQAMKMSDTRISQPNLRSHVGAAAGKISPLRIETQDKTYSAGQREMQAIIRQQQ